MPLEGGPSCLSSPTPERALGGTTLPAPGERFQGARLEGFENAAGPGTAQDAEKRGSGAGFDRRKKRIRDSGAYRLTHARVRL